MAEQTDVEFIPITQAKMMGRGARLSPQLYAYYGENVKKAMTESGMAGKMPIPEGVTYVTLKNRLLRVAKDLGVELVVRKSSNFVLFWKATIEDVDAKTEVVERLQGTRRGGRQRGGGRRG